ncbi:MAG: type III pantothenate kinase [Planctomycetota bacterium]
MIALDIGNGSVKWGRFDGNRLVEHGRLPLDADPAQLPADAAVSVNPPVAQRWKAAHPALQLLGTDRPLPLPVRYPDCGDDRVCAVAGALRDVEAALVLDAGTCLVATVGTRSDGVLGGAILPGPQLMARALADGTAALPLVDPVPPETAVGDSTPASIRAGIDAAVIGAARELITRIRAEMAFPVAVFATGTGGEALAGRLPEIASFKAFLPLWGVASAVGF